MEFQVLSYNPGVFYDEVQIADLKEQVNKTIRKVKGEFNEYHYFIINDMNIKIVNDSEKYSKIFSYCWATYATEQHNNQS